MIYIILFAASWLLFILFVDRSRIGEYLPSMIFAGFLGIITDIFMLYYKIWDYHHYYPLPEWSVAVLLDIGIYAVVAGLFIQWMPSRPALQLLYIFPWTVSAILFEYLFIRMEWMHHHQWWNLRHSYIADWVIFYMILLQYEFYRRAQDFKSPTRTS
jgi:hypothetical protein